MFGFDKQDVRLTYNFLKMTLRDKYLGSVLGGVWAIVNPLLLMGIYTFVFAFMFKTRLPGSDSSFAYTIWLVSGYGPWMATTEAIMAASNSIVSSSGIVKNMAFKTEILPIAYALTAIVPLAVSFIFVTTLLIISGNAPTWEALFLLPIIALQFFFFISLGFFLAAITVFIRDVSIVLPNILMMILFLTPIFYPLESMPHIIRMISSINPFYIVAESYRDVLISHQFPNMWSLLYVFILASGLSFVGLNMFRRVKGYFTAAL